VQEIILEKGEDGLAFITLNRPARMNALGRQIVEELGQAIAAVEADPGVRVVVLTGSSPSPGSGGARAEAFCAGADLKERRDMAPEQVRHFVNLLRATMGSLASLSKPTIAAINGFALGGGCELALACDMRVMASAAVIGLPETHLGIIPGAGGTQRLARLLGPSLAKELIFSGRRLTGEAAQRVGLVNVVAEGGGLEEAVRALAGPILTAAPIALAQAKRAIDGGLDVALGDGLKLEERCYDVTIPTEDRLEALDAFRNKRRPVFKGR